MSKIKILHVLIGNMNCGGIESELMQIYRNIDKESFHFDFVVHDENENFYEKEIMNLGGQLYRVPYLSMHLMRHIFAFSRLLKQHPEYRIIHIHTTYSIMIVDACIAKLHKRSIIIHSHNASANRKRSALHKLFKYPFYHFADARIACSDLAAKWMFSTKSIRKNQIYFWRNPIDLEPFLYNERARKELRSQYGLENAFIIVHVGRLSYQKNQQFLLDIMSYLHKQTNEVFLWMVGDGEDKNMLEDIVLEKGIQGHVQFFGNVNNVNDFLSAADLFCFPSLYEGLPVIGVEAQVNGIPILASSEITKEIKINENYYVENLHSGAEQWAKRILKEKTAWKRVDASSFVQNTYFNIKKEINALEELYSSLAE